jgi:hypothetical protein
MHAVEDGVPCDKKTPSGTIVLREGLIRPASFFQPLAAITPRVGISDPTAINPGRESRPGTGSAPYP